MLVVKKTGIDFNVPNEKGESHAAFTLRPEEVCEPPISRDAIINSVGKCYTRTHTDSGWTISGIIKEDWFLWVNEFVAIHPQMGFVCGDFEHEIVAVSQEAFDHFYKHHTPHGWDYGDI